MTAPENDTPIDVAGDGGTSHCSLAESEIGRLTDEQDDVLRFITERNEVAHRIASQFIPGPDAQDDIDRQKLVDEWLEHGRDEVDDLRAQLGKAVPRMVRAENERDALRRLVADAHREAPGLTAWVEVTGGMDAALHRALDAADTEGEGVSPVALLAEVERLTAETERQRSLVQGYRDATMAVATRADALGLLDDEGDHPELRAAIGALLDANLQSYPKARAVMAGITERPPVEGATVYVLKEGRPSGAAAGVETGVLRAHARGVFHGLAHAAALPGTAQVTEYRFRPVPTTVVRDGYHWDVHVVRQGTRDAWVVTTRHGDYADVDAVWCEAEDRWSPDSEDWDGTHVFPFDQAVEVAERAQWTQVINGLTARDVLARHAGESE